MVLKLTSFFVRFSKKNLNLLYQHGVKLGGFNIILTESREFCPLETSVTFGGLKEFLFHSLREVIFPQI